MSLAVILSHGVPPSREILERIVRSASCFVCADGAADVARSFGLVPEAIVGDLDSVTEATLAAFTDARVIRDADTERTDTEKALRYVLDRGPFDDIVILGGTADRLDHVLGHLSLLVRYAGRGRITIQDDRCRAWIAEHDVALDDPAGTVVSFFAVGAPAEGVTTSNLRYPLTNSRIEMGTQDSISNVVTASPARIRIAKGKLLVLVVTRP